MKLPKNLQERFKLVRLLHKTDKSRIWLVEEVATKKRYVLREMQRTNLAYKEISQVKHKNLLEIILVEETDAATFVIEEFLQGENLFEYVKKHGEFGEEKICEIGIEICNCLEKLHVRHIIHRDIKPENLFLTDAGILKLIDFDAARIEKSGLVADTNIMGTPGYAAPEQYGFQQTDARTDIFSLGLTLKKLAGYENYSGFLTPIFKKCASFDPAQRYNSAKDLRAAIIQRRRLHKLKKFLTVAFAGLAIYFFMTNENPAPAEEKIFVEEKITATTSNIDSKPPEIEKNPPSENFLPIIYPQEENAPAPVYERYTPPSNFQAEISTFNAEKLVDEITEKVDALNLPPPPKMPFRDFKNQMRNLNLSENELLQKYEEHYRRLEFNQRVAEFRKLLPQNLSAEEINAASMLFNRQEKQRLNLD